MLKKVCTVLLLILSFSHVTAQSRVVDRDNFMWLTYAVNKPLKNNFKLSASIQSRRYIFPDRQHQFLPSVEITKGFKSGINISAGFTYFLQALPQTRQDVEVVRPELRPYQRISTGRKIGNWKINHRFTLEERWFRNTEGEELVEGYFFNFRLRYRVMLQRDLNQDGDLILVLSDEVMANAGSSITTNIFDQNRIYAGLKKNFSEQISVDLGYMYWYQQTDAITAFNSWHIINIGVSHSL